MGNSAHSLFTEIEKKYKHPGVDYIAYRSNQRSAYEQTRDEHERILRHATIQEDEDIEWIRQEKRLLEQALEDAKHEAEIHKRGLIAQSEAKQKKNVQEFSGYNTEVKRLEDLEKEVREKHRAEREKVKGRIDQEINRLPNPSTLTAIPEFDSKSDSQKKSIEEECIKKYPSKATKFNSVEFERTLKWDNFKPNFAAILNKDSVGKQNTEARERIKANVVPSKAPVCC